MKLMEFYFTHFHHIQLAIPTHRYFRLALTVAKQIVQAHKKNKKKKESKEEPLLAKLKKIEENTTSELNIPLISVQLAITNAPLVKEIELKTNDNKLISRKPLYYIRHLYQAYEEICEVVTEVCKGYSLDIAYGFGQGAGSDYFEKRV